MVATKEEIRSVFCVRVHDGKEYSIGTAFVMKSSEGRFLITARHVVLGDDNQVVVPEFFRNDEWFPIPASEFIPSSDKNDIVVFPIDEPLADEDGEYPVELGSSTKIHHGATALIAGFPYGWHRAGEKINNGCPVPIVKHVGIGGVVFAHDTTHAEHKDMPLPAIILDRGIPEGFSGSPVFYRDPFSGKPSTGTTYAIGVVTQQWFDDKQSSDGMSGLGVAAFASIPLELIQKFLDANKCNTPTA